MEALFALAIGSLVSVGVFLMLQRSVIRTVLGLFLLSHAANLVILLMGGLKRNAVPIVRPEVQGQVVTDPLVQALLLTAIVIGFGLAAFLMVMMSQAHREAGSDDLENLRGLRG